MARKTRKNPDTMTYVAIGAVLLGGGWSYQRMRERKKLRDLLAGSQVVVSAHGANIIAWTPEQKAAEEIGLTNMTSAEEAFTRILSELQPMLPADAVPQIEQSTIAGKVYETTRSGWNYVSDAIWGSAKENPALSWDEFLSGLE